MIAKSSVIAAFVFAMSTGIGLAQSTDTETQAPAAETTETTPAPATEAPVTEAPATEAPVTEAPQAAEEQEAPREIVKSVHGDWEIRCNADETYCFLFQVGKSQQGNPVIEFSMIDLPADQKADGGVTIVAPLGTLLTRGVTIQVDGGRAQPFPFQTCTRIGCFARFGFTKGQVNQFKRGNVAKVTLVSAAQPNQPVVLDISLSGFTAGFNALSGN